MMRYNRKQTGDWVEVEGVSDLPMRDYVVLLAGNFTEAAALGRSVITASHFKERGGAEFTLADDADWMRLSPRQWAWLRDTFRDAVRDEVLDPLADAA